MYILGSFFSSCECCAYVRLLFFHKTQRIFSFEGDKSFDDLVVFFVVVVVLVVSSLSDNYLEKQSNTFGEMCFTRR